VDAEEPEVLYPVVRVLFCVSVYNAAAEVFFVCKLLLKLLLADGPDSRRRFPQ